MRGISRSIECSRQSVYQSAAVWQSLIAWKQLESAIMAWVRPLVLFLLALRSVAVLFSRDENGHDEYTHLLHFSASYDRAIILATTPAEAVWQLVGVVLVYQLNLSLWYLLWWILLGFVVIIIVGKLLLRRLNP
jgi:cytochrome oxidase assembly protein ShyY1